MSNSSISKRYARALFSLGQEDGYFVDYGEELQEFTDFYKKNDEFGNAITNPLFRKEDRKKILDYVLDRSGFSTLVINFIKLLLDKNRITTIEFITENYKKLTDEALNIAYAQIFTARPLKQKALNMVIKSLEEMTSKKIKSDIREDRELIGGMVVKIGDLVLDGSIKAQLEGLKESFRRGE